MTKPQSQAGRWPAGRRTRCPSGAAAAQPPESRARRPGPAPSPARSPTARPLRPLARDARAPSPSSAGGRAWDRRGRPIKFPLAAAGGDSPSRERGAGSRRTAGSCLFPRRLPAERRRRRAPRRTRSPPSDLEATASVNMHTHTLAHDNFVVKGGPTPADLHLPTHSTPGAQNHTEQVCVHGATSPHLQIQK